MDTATQTPATVPAIDATATRDRITLVGTDDFWEAYESWLLGAGYEVYRSLDFSNLHAHGASAHAELLVVQVDLTGADDIDLATEIGPGVGIVALASRSSPEARVALLGAGVDVCLETPIEPAELAANIQSVLRRIRQGRERVILTGEARIYLERGKVTDRDGRLIALSPGEFRILELLATAQGEFVSAEALSRAIRPDNANPKVGSVTVMISHLRKKLDDVDQRRRLIVNYRREGYRLVTGFRPALDGVAVSLTQKAKRQIDHTRPRTFGPSMPDPVALYLCAARKERRISRPMVEQMTDGWVTASALAHYETGKGEAGNALLVSLLRKLYGISRSKLDKLSQSAESVEDKPR